MGQPEFDITCTVDGLFETWGTDARPPGRKRMEALTEVLDSYEATIDSTQKMCGYAFAPVKTSKGMLVGRRLLS